MDSATIEQALQRLGDRFDYHRSVEVLLVGAAAGMVTGVLPASRTTMDCDVMVYEPSSAATAVESAAAAVAAELGLPPTWLNSDVQIRADALPDEWKSRRVWVGDWGRLRVWAAGRADLVAMKFLAGRAQDLEDLRTLRVRSEEVGFVRRYLESLRNKGTSPGQIDEALALLRSWKVEGDD